MTWWLNMEETEAFLAINAAYPHIGKKLKLLWGHKECVDYIEELLTDTRGGTRRGFPFGVVIALGDLQTLHNKEFAHLAPPGDLWDHV